jgi:hypothetical protein
VKSVYYPDHHTLIKEHFFPGQHKDGLLNIFLGFMETHPLKIQFQHRMHNVLNSFRLQELAHLFKLLKQEDTITFIRYWSDKEFFLFSFSIYPLSIMAGFSKVFSKILSPAQYVGEIKRTSQLSREAVALFFVSMLTVISLVFLSYSKAPDMNHQLPMGTVLIIHTLLIGFILKNGFVGRLILFLYASCSAWRITTLIFAA